MSDQVAAGELHRTRLTDLSYGQSDQRLAEWNGWQIPLGAHLAQPQQRRGIDRGPQVADQDLTFLDFTNVPRGNDKTISRDVPLRMPCETHFTADHVAHTRGLSELAPLSVGVLQPRSLGPRDMSLCQMTLCRLQP